MLWKLVATLETDRLSLLIGEPSTTVVTVIDRFGNTLEGVNVQVAMDRAGATVTPSGDQITDANGQFRIVFNAQQPGTYTLQVTPANGSQVLSQAIRLCCAG